SYSGAVTITLTYVEGSGVEGSSLSSTLLISTNGDIPTPPTPPTPGDLKLYVVGDMTEWSVDPSYEMTKNGNVYTLTLPNGLNGEWKINNGTWDMNFGAGDEQPVEGVESEVWYNGANIVSSYSGAVTITLTYVEGSGVEGSSLSSTLLISTNGDIPTPPTPGSRTLYLVGEMTGWDLDTNYIMSQNGNVYTITLPDGLNGEWKIYDGTWDYNFGVGEEQPVNGVECDAWFDGGNFITTATGKVTVTFTLIEGSDVKDSSIASKVLVQSSGSSFVENIEVVEEAVYYNLQGVQVSNPANGIYIKVANGKATRVVVK
ncbi:MAG: hypothetical protein K2J15_05630, partial [Muribaculaceae bacterium]|nr:hypothetical protein [Muribaculaceae bacterium]